jgi:Ca2+-binding RTX toxin-like protein
MANPTAREQEFLELINRMRMAPAAELALLLNSSDPDIQAALTYFNVNLNTLRTQWSSLTAVAPLAWSSQLDDVASAHNQKMIQYDQQSHQVGVYDSSGNLTTAYEPNLAGRLTAGNYNFTNGGENIYAYAKSILYADAGFAIDWGGTAATGGIQNPAGHRNNMMSSNFREVGVSVTDETNPNTQVGPLVVTENFGNRSALTGKGWLLGVAFQDTNKDGWYEAGEGLNDVQVKITGINGTTFTDTISVASAGGYQDLLNPGQYRVDFIRNGAIVSTKTTSISTDNVKIDLLLPVLGSDTVESSISYTLTPNVKNLTLTGTANINGTGNTLDNLILGNSGNNILDGGAGNDTLNGGAGDDFLGDYGGGNDLLIGGDGNDSLYGGAGNDTLIGGMGNDSYYLSYTASDLTNDTIVENPGEGIDTAYSIFTVTALAANVENLTLLGTDNINGTGNSLDNLILGNSGNNTLDGGAGNDFIADFYNTGVHTLIGGEGNDILYGGGANDTLIGGNGDDTYYLSLVPTELANDTITETATGGIDNAIAASSAILADNIEKLYLVGTADINGTGNSSDNTILGNSGNNSLFGGAGNDFLGDYAGGNDTFNGGAGNDILFGGTGNDSFVFSGNSLLSFQTALGVDNIADFTVGDDIILLSKGNFGSLGTAAGNSLLSADFATVTTDTATTLGSSIVYNSVNGKLFYDANGSAAGFGTGGQFAQLSSGLGLTGNDFKAIA